MGPSVVILTFNEERNLPGALESLAGLADDIVVFDSFSSDRTCEIARDALVRVEQRAFDNYAAQRNAALSVPYKYPWVLMLDADERVTPELWNEMRERCTAANEGIALFRMRRKDFFLGKWIRRSSGYPTWFGRLIRVGRVTVMRDINEEYVPTGDVGHLEGHLVHFPFNRGVSHWVDRHNQYSTMEACRLVDERVHALSFRGFLSRDPTIRRRSWKRLAYKLPLRPQIAFAYLYFIRLGFLDGLQGLWYCRLRANYEFLIDLKAKELKMNRKDS